jgi:two-component system, chemotaxis family, chemotaxis protein CheY
MHTRRILVVDDEDRLRRALRTVLERAGYEVREARSGQDAVRLWREEESDLVITDIHMSDKDGIETILELRALSPDLPIIAVSGSGERKCRDLLRDAKLLGTVQTLDKPFGLNEVLHCVSQMFQGADQRESQA